MSTQLRALRLKAGLTQAQLAKLVTDKMLDGSISPHDVKGISKQVIGRLERGIRKIQPAEMLALCQVLADKVFDTPRGVRAKLTEHLWSFHAQSDMQTLALAAEDEPMIVPVSRVPWTHDFDAHEWILSSTDDLCASWLMLSPGQQRAVLYLVNVRFPKGVKSIAYTDEIADALHAYLDNKNKGDQGCAEPEVEEGPEDDADPYAGITIPPALIRAAIDLDVKYLVQVVAVAKIWARLGNKTSEGGWTGINAVPRETLIELIDIFLMFKTYER